MIGLPAPGDRIKIYPAKGRKIQNGSRPLDSGGRYLPEEGADVVWSEFHLEQYRAGDFTLHNPAPLPAPKAESPKASAKDKV